MRANNQSQSRSLTLLGLVLALVSGCATQTGPSQGGTTTAPPPANSESPLLSGVSGNKLLAIFAHADDEITVAPMLARYAEEGIDVYLAIVTDGRKGSRPGGPTGRELKAIRAKEARCSAATLGINPPILMDFVDGELSANLDRLQGALKNLVARISPDVVVTWGPEGGYGHVDHRLVGAMVAGIYQARQPGTPELLLYHAIPKGRIRSFRPRSEFGSAIKSIWGVTDPSYLPYRIAVEKRHVEAAKAASACHASQWDVRALRDVQSLIDSDTVHLRPSHVRLPRSQTIFRRGSRKDG